MSRGEYAINKYLEDNEFDFQREATFDDLKGINGGSLRYDFKVENWDNRIVLIEFDGGQHFKPVTFGHKTPKEALDAFKTTRTHDRIKNDYCTDNGYPLLRIKYDNIELIDVMLEKFFKIHKFI
eukprot:Lithocolla_globosa_v1_NODE_1791_length_2337_cov_73.939089.p1 type:complete len:124 gc:universal NODE_1791_length_2337_cov_73.939089:1075-704(-)